MNYGKGENMLQYGKKRKNFGDTYSPKQLNPPKPFFFTSWQSSDNLQAV